MMTLDTSKYPVDPINALVNIGLIAINPTKFIFANHGLQLDERYGQAVRRAFSGDGRNDISELSYIFLRGARLYQPNKNKEVRAIFQFATQGLESLKRMYSGERITEEAIGHRITEINTYCTTDVEPLSETDKAGRELGSIWSETELKKLCGILMMNLEGAKKEGGEQPKAVGSPQAPAKAANSTKGKKGDKQTANVEGEQKEAASTVKSEDGQKSAETRKTSVEADLKAINRVELDAYLAQQLTKFTEIFHRQLTSQYRYMEEDNKATAAGK